MPAFTFTFTANATTNEITIVGHGHVTGDGPATPRNVGGALPGGLTALTDYWLIRVDNDTLKLATSSSNAMAGTAVDLTTAGSGTNILEIGIPYRRPRTYGPASGGAAGSQLKSVDLNGNFDSWKALHALLTGQAQSVWDGITLQGPLVVVGDVSVEGVIARPEASIGLSAMAFQHISTLPSPAPQSGVTLWTLFTSIHSPVHIPSGMRIKRVVYRAKRNSATGSATGSISVFNAANDTGLSLDSTTIAPTPGVGVIDNYTTPDIDYEIQPEDSISISITQAPNNALQFHRATVYFDVPMPP